MSSPVFVAEPGLVAKARIGHAMVLGGTEGRHAATVTRVRRGEAIEVVDGQGTRIMARVRDLGRDELTVEVLDLVHEPEPNPAFVVVQALPKGEHADLAVDQLTQAGVDRILPWAAANCVARWDAERVPKGQVRWQQTAIQAAKQSRRSRIPRIESLAGTQDVEQAVRAADLAISLHEEATEPLSQVALVPSGTILVIVGPEGGLAPSERERLGAAGAREARLGPQVLRTSLAGPVALAILSGRGRWRSVAEPTGHLATMQGWPT